jgi:hypothetical protein
VCVCVCVCVCVVSNINQRHCSLCISPCFYAHESELQLMDSGVCMSWRRLRSPNSPVVSKQAVHHSESPVGNVRRRPVERTIKAKRTTSVRGVTKLVGDARQPSATTNPGEAKIPDPITIPTTNVTALRSFRVRSMASHRPFDEPTARPRAAGGLMKSLSCFQCARSGAAVCEPLKRSMQLAGLSQVQLRFAALSSSCCLMALIVCNDATSGRGARGGVLRVMLASQWPQHLHGCPSSSRGCDPNNSNDKMRHAHSPHLAAPSWWHALPCDSCNCVRLQGEQQLYTHVRGSSLVLQLYLCDLAPPQQVTN